METFDRIDRNFTYHPPNEISVKRLQAIRSNGKALAFLIDDLVPESREKSLAITHLEQAVMWANAGIARYQEEV